MSEYILIYTINALYPTNEDVLVSCTLDRYYTENTIGMSGTNRSHIAANAS